MKSALFTLSVAAAIAPALAAVAQEVPDVSLADWDWNAEETEPLEAYLVSSNITIGDWDEIDPTMAGVTALPTLETEEFIGPSEEASELETRDSRYNDRTTKVSLGRRYIDWGCGTNVRNNLRRAVEYICRDGDCDQGLEYVVKVKAGVTGQVTGKRGNLRIKVTDGYYKGNVRHRLIEGLQATSIAKTHKGYTKRWAELGGRGGTVPASCHMTRWPNYVSIIRRNRKTDGVIDRIPVRITPPGGDKQDGKLPCFSPSESVRVGLLTCLS